MSQNTVLPPPIVSPRISLAEMTIKALLLGAVLSMLLAAANAYIGLLVGLTVSASIPAAAVSMGVLKLFKRLAKNFATLAGDSDHVDLSIVFVLQLTEDLLLDLVLLSVNLEWSSFLTVCALNILMWVLMDTNTLPSYIRKLLFKRPRGGYFAFRKMFLVRFQGILSETIAAIVLPVLFAIDIFVPSSEKLIASSRKQIKLFDWDNSAEMLWSAFEKVLVSKNK